jgi:DHA1 family bicyclomycin/chloramphenicol resistance-like MFS transporter
MASRRAIVNSLTVLVCLSAVTVDICLPAFPAISRSFNVPAGDTHLLVSVYLLSYGGAQIPLGYLSERIGRIRTVYLGISVFLLGGVAATFATSLEMLLAARFVQGLGGAVGPVMARAIARDVSSGAELGRLMSVFVTALAVSTLVAPVAGSALLAVFSWPSVFAVSVLFGVFCLMLVRLFVPETLPSSDPAGNRFTAHAAEFFSHRPAVIGTSMLGLLFMGYIGFLSSFSTIAADQFDRPDASIGWWFAVFVGFYLLGANLTRRASGEKHDARLLDLGSLLLVGSVVVFILVRFGLVGELIGLSIGLLCYLFALGMMLGVLSAHVLRGLPHIAGTAAGLMGALQMLSGVVGGTASAFLYRGDAWSTVLILVVSAVLTVALYLAGRRSLSIPAH